MNSDDTVQNNSGSEDRIVLNGVAYSTEPERDYAAVRLVTDNSEEIPEEKRVTFPDGTFGERVENDNVITLMKIDNNEKRSYGVPSYLTPNAHENENAEIELNNEEPENKKNGGKYAPFFFKSFKSSKKNKKTKGRKGPRKLNTRRRRK